MPIVATRGNAGAFAYGFTAGGAPEVLGGMVLITPTSVDKTGTGSTATIGTNGSVEFSSCATLSLNGVFNTDYDNYMISVRYLGTVNGEAFAYRLRASGTDNSTSNSYVTQNMYANGTSVTGVRYTLNLGYFSFADDSQRGGANFSLYGPYLAQPTAVRSTVVDGFNDAVIPDWAGTHNQSTAYDGITIYPGTGSITGLVSVYGLVGT
jgi:hypothetical protein